MTDPVMLLSQLHGEGRVTFRALRAAGFFTLSAVAEATVQALADRAHLSTRSARRLKTGAEELIGAGVAESTEVESAGVTRKRRRNGSRAAFSEGVSFDEALLLGQGAPAAALFADAEPVAAPLEPAGQASGAASEMMKAEIAAAAEAAASLTRHPARPPARPADKEPSPDRTFWVFG